MMGTVSFEVPGPGTYQVQCDPSLAPLANPAAAGDVLAGKRFYNDQSQAVIGTMANNPPEQVSVAGGQSYTIPQGYHDGTGTVTGTGTVLPTLTNPGTAGDLLENKQLLDGNGKIVTGTLVPGADTSDATATAGDILAPKTAYVAAGKVTGTIVTKGASDVTADGPLVAVPPGYYPQAVNKTVSDPDLVPGNIKAGVEIFGVTGSLASSFSAVLVVTVDSGAEVTATDGTTTLTATSTGTATFHLPNGGTWTVSATLNGSQAAPATVEVQENFSLALSAGATQTVNIPTQYEAELSFTPSRLPDGYTEVEYITAAESYIEKSPLGNTPLYNKCIDLKFKLNDLGSSSHPGYIFGNQYFYQKYSTPKKFQISGQLVCVYQGAIAIESGYTNTNTSNEKQVFSVDINTQDPISLKIDAAKSKISINGIESPLTISIPNNSYSSWSTLFALDIYTYWVNSVSGPEIRDERGAGPVSLNLFYLDVYESTETSIETKIIEMVPCIDPSGVVGLYDVVSGVFWKSTGANFSAGPAV